MTHNERHHIAARLVRTLRARGLLTKTDKDPAPLIADELEKAARDYNTGDPMRRASYLAEAVAEMKREIRSIIPRSFGWWLEFDHDVRASVRWVWLGHPAVTRCGSVSDSCFSLALQFLRAVDWDQEIRRAMSDIEETEAKLLRQAQDRRRLILTDSAHLLETLPPIELPAPPPATFTDKRLAAGPLEIPQARETAEEQQARIRAALAGHIPPGYSSDEDDSPTSGRPLPPVWDEDEDDDEEDPADWEDDEDEEPGPELDELPAPAPAQSLSPSPAPAAPAVPAASPAVPRAPAPTGRPRLPDEEGKPRLAFGLSRERSRLPVAFVKFEPYASLSDLSAAVKAAPAGTYAQAYLHGGEEHVFGPAKVWEAFGYPEPPERTPEPSGRRS